MVSRRRLTLNKRFEPTAQKPRLWVPSALRALASAQATRYMRVALAMLLFLSSAATAADCESHVPALCAQIRVGDELARADATLNEVYRRLMTALPKQRRQELRSEQRRWLKLDRDAACAKRIEREWGGSCSTTWCLVGEDQCRANATNVRKNLLEQQLAGATL